MYNCMYGGIGGDGGVLKKALYRGESGGKTLTEARGARRTRGGIGESVLWKIRGVYREEKRRRKKGGGVIWMMV